MGKKKILTICCSLVLSLACSLTAFGSFERGDDGQEVLDIQKRLVELHYDVSNLDGNYGSETETAIKQFQADRGLESDGVIGSETYQALMNKEMPANRGRSTSRRVLSTGYSVLGTPYVFGGTTPYGFDCSGFTAYCFASVGIDLPHAADDQYSCGRPVSISNLRPGDLVFFSTYEDGISHVGIYTGNGTFIHSGSSTGVAVADLFDGYWGSRYVGACRVM